MAVGLNPEEEIISQQMNHLSPASDLPPLGTLSKDSVTYTWNDINVFVSQTSSNKDDENQATGIKGFFTKKKKETKQILKNVTGLARPGELMAIIGSSGAGKTTLLNVLTCRNTGKLKLTGERLVNGQSVDRDTLAANSAYIQQSDIFIGTLTPREHLQFQATLRMDKSISYKRRMERVEEVMQEMGLLGCADTIIGIPGRIKGLSGGQQKRLSIATEILTDPWLLFCDEPTTGLDSFMAQSIVNSLKVLASRGKTVICTIHQPSSQSFALFNRLLIMSEGRTAFIGDCKDGLSFFAEQGYPSPKNYNPADFYIFTLAIRAGDEEACLQRSKELSDAFSDSHMAQKIKEEVESKNYTNIEGGQKAMSQSPYKASWGTQFNACLWRSWKTVLNDPLVLKIQLAQAVFISLLIGVIYLGQEMDQEGIQNINGFIFMLITSLTFSSVFPVANVFWNELPVFMREHYNGTYTTHAYYLAKTTAELPVYILIPAIFSTIDYWMVGLNPASDRFIIAVAVSVLIANVASSFGYMVSTVSSSLEMALALVPVFIMPFFLFGGTFLNKDSIPVYFIWLKYLSWFLHGNEALSINQWKGVKNITCEGNGGCIDSGDLVLKTLSFDEDNFGLAIGVLFALIFVGRILSYVGLWAKTRKED